VDIRTACLTMFSVAAMLSAGPVTAQCNLGCLPGIGLPGISGLAYAIIVWDPDGAGPSLEMLVAGRTN
jgi:hypothetical protein